MSAARPVELTLCRLDEIEDGQARGFTLQPPAGAGSEAEKAGSGAPPRPPEVEILVFRQGEAVHGYVNSCPHIGSPLDWLPNRFMSEDGKHLHCATHGALFRPEDGFCVSGPCEGDSLKPVEVRVKKGAVVFRP